MASPRLVFILVSVLTLTSILTVVSLSRSQPRHYAASDSSGETRSSFRSFFSFRTPSALFPSSAIISLTDDNSTFFLARPADFGPDLPSNGFSAQLWVGSGFGDDNLGRGLVTETEGELGCSDVPGWRSGRKNHQGDSPFEPSAQIAPGKTEKRNEPSNKLDHSVSSIRQYRGRQETTPSKKDGTDDHLHHPLPESSLLKPRVSGRSPDTEHRPVGQPAQHADIQSLQEGAEISGKLVLLSRGGCGFLEKVKWVQRRGGSGLIVGDNTRGGALVTMYARGDTSNITIPALFTSRTTAHLLSSLIPPEDSDDDDEDPPAEDQDGDVRDDLPTFTPTGFIPSPTTIAPVKGSAGSYGSRFATSSEQTQSKGWARSLLGMKPKKGENSADQGSLDDSRRPSGNGRLTWISEQWTESTKTPVKGRPNERRHSRDGVDASPGDGFEIGVHDWRDPDLLGVDAVPVASTASASTKIPSATDQSTGGKPNSDDVQPSGGSITPSSGEYDEASMQSTPPKGRTLDSSNRQKQSWLGRIFSKSTSKEVEATSTNMQAENTRQRSTQKSDTSTSPKVHEGLWITLTPTTMSTSPFFDTLLVLVVSPLITLTVVYSLLLIRSRIRRRRWRAPKSVVERLPVRTYHTMSCSSSTSSSSLATPAATSPTTPLLQSRPRSATSQSRPRSYTASSIGDAVSDSLDRATARASLKRRETSSKTPAKKKAYHGKQVECVVCLEEYIDGQSRVMSLPCGHEFHAECITPWLTTRRRTCPICKGDVVRSMAKPLSNPSPNASEPRPTAAGQESDVQTQAAETTNDSPTAAIPIPRDPADLERGDDLAATLVDDPPEESTSRRRWRGLASLSLSAFSGEASWRQFQTDRNR